MIRALAVVAVVLGLAGLAGLPRRAHAEPAPPGDAVALLPLDAERNLELYGQPVASEIARALVAGNVAVVVVGPKMAVPELARLIIDGTIALGKAGAVTISLRIRNTVDGVTLENLSATAPGLAKIDAAASELSARLLPLVRDRLAALHKSSEDHGRVAEVRSPPAAPMLVLVADVQRTRSSAPGLLLGALDAAVASFCHAHHREIRKLEPTQRAARTVAQLGPGLAIGFWILDYSALDGKPPMARARVRVQIAQASTVVFDRVVVTDTVLGEAGLGPKDLAERVAREILAILRPHMRRSVPSWP
ncbi:MAG TPA: hypothetical protein VF469_09140 [Kofleriaceae bacterium]